MIAPASSGPPGPGLGPGLRPGPGNDAGAGLRLAVRSESLGEELGEGDAADRVLGGQVIAAAESGERGARDADRQHRATAPAGGQVHAGEPVGASDLGPPISGTRPAGGPAASSASRPATSPASIGWKATRPRTTTTAPPPKASHPPRRRS